MVATDARQVLPVPDVSARGMVVGVILRPTVWQRRHLWVWNAGNSVQTTRQWLAANAKRQGWGAVCVKVHDGADIFHGPEGDNADPAYFKTLRDAGLIVGGWGYLTGDGLDGNAQGGVEAEALRAVERCRTLGLSFYVADPEDRYSYSPVDNPVAGAGRKRYGYSVRFVRKFTSCVNPAGLSKTFPRAVASYGRCDLHDLDWHAWSRPDPYGAVWRCAPQAYANESPALDVDLCVRAALPYWPRPLIHPLLGVYNGSLGRHSATEYAAELRRSGVKGWGVYDADSMTETEIAEYGKIAV